MPQFLREIEETIQQTVPADALVTNVELEASEVIIYTKNIGKFLHSDGLMSSLAKKLKKRVHVRSDKSQLMDPEQAEEKIREMVPEGTGVDRIDFNKANHMVYIQAKKVGLVIGKGGRTLKKITTTTGWYPKIWRVPVAPSPVVDGIRKTLLKNAEDRQKFLKKTAKEIYREEKKSVDWAKLTPLGGSREVGRSCFLLETPESKIMIDCGVNVASEGDRYPLLDSLDFSLDELSSVILSHAHLDHSGFIPYLFKYGYDGPVYATPPTRAVSVLLSLDYLDIAAKEGRDPPFGKKHIKKMITHMILHGYEEVTDIAPDARLTLYNAGHILGSSAAHLHLGKGDHNLLYTGDFNFGHTRLFDAMTKDYPRVESLVMESTYGGKNDIQPKRGKAEKQLISTIKRVTDRGGSVLVPVFAIGRAQEIMLVIERYARQNGWDLPVYLDGMTREANAIHTVYPEYLKSNVKKRILHNKSPFESDIFIDVDASERHKVAHEKSSVILSPSGMLTGGPSVDYFKNMCENEKNAIIFVGYQGKGSLGRKIQNLGNNGKSKKIPLRDNGRTRGYKVNMDIHTIEGFSGHADRRQLLGFYKKLNPKPNRVMTVHGDSRKCETLGRDISRKFHTSYVSPRNLDTIRLS